MIDEKGNELEINCGAVLVTIIYKLYLLSEN